MVQGSARTNEGEAGTNVVLATFRANGIFLAAGDLLAAEVGLTAARWQVMGAVALAGRPLTVPQIARRMGLTRQSVQASVDRLIDDGLLETEANPDHRRSRLVRLSNAGLGTYERLQERQTTWINELVRGMSESDLITTARVLAELDERLNTEDPKVERRTDRATA